MLMNHLVGRLFKLINPIDGFKILTKKLRLKMAKGNPEVGLYGTSLFIVAMIWAFSSLFMFSTGSFLFFSYLIGGGITLLLVWGVWLNPGNEIDEMERKKTQ